MTTYVNKSAPLTEKMLLDAMGLLYHSGSPSPKWVVPPGLIENAGPYGPLKKGAPVYQTGVKEAVSPDELMGVWYTWHGKRMKHGPFHADYVDGPYYDLVQMDGVTVIYIDIWDEDFLDYREMEL